MTPATKSLPRVLDCVTPPQYGAHAYTLRAYLDTGAGFYIEPGRFLPSWWVGGWDGPREKINTDAVLHMAFNLPERATWILNVWENKYDQRILSNDVERCVDQIRNDILIPLHKARPDIRRGFYASIPSEHYDITMYHKARRALASNPNDAWWRNTLAQVEPRYKAWVKAVTRMTFGFDDTGKLDTGGGLIDELDILNPKCYLVGDANDGAFDANDIESDGDAIREQVGQCVRVGGGRSVYPMMTPYIEGTSNPPKRHRLEIAMKVAREAGASGAVIWHYTGGRMPSEYECSVMDMAVNVWGGRAAA